MYFLSFYEYILPFCFILFGKFSPCTRTKSQTRDVSYQIKPTFHLWWLWIIFRRYFDPKTVFIKLFHIKAKQIFIALEFFQAQIGCMQSTQCSLNTAHLQCFKSLTQNSHTSNLLKNQRDVRLLQQCFLYGKVWFRR